MELGAILLLLIFSIFYFLPSIIAYGRNHPNIAPIVILDIFLGWTILGWVICLAWSANKIKQD